MFSQLALQTPENGLKLIGYVLSTEHLLRALCGDTKLPFRMPSNRVIRKISINFTIQFNYFDSIVVIASLCVRASFRLVFWFLYRSIILDS